MICPTCGYPMDSIVSSVGHCLRCGSLRIEHGQGRVEVLVPKLVRRCRQFQMRSIGACSNLWQSLGIAESIHPPEDRPR